MSFELGFSYDQILDLPYRVFKMYTRQLSNYYEEMEASQKGIKKQPKFSKEEKAQKRKKLEEIRNANKVHTGGERSR